MDVPRRLAGRGRLAECDFLRSQALDDMGDIERRPMLFGEEGLSAATLKA